MHTNGHEVETNPSPGLRPPCFRWAGRGTGRGAQSNSCLLVFIAGFNGFQWQTQNEAASASFARFIHDFAAVRPRDLPRNRQSQTRALDATAQRIMRPVEFLSL